MRKRLPRVYTIAPGENFLEILATQILNGFPDGELHAPLGQWTVLVPTRRSAKALAHILKKTSGQQSLVLPRIKPIGDLDEGLSDDAESDHLPKALSPAAQLLQLTQLIDHWARDHPHIALAQEISDSQIQRLNLAQSLMELIETIETHERNFEKLAEVYAADLSQHREAILSLLDVLRVSLPKLRHDEGVISATEHRNGMIRLEALRIREGKTRGPLIVAGSTGTIPATRALLAAIANDVQGAVVLPGLDQLGDAASWDALPQEHAQYSMKLVLDEMGLNRRDVRVLGRTYSARQLLASELMRPSATTEVWHHTLSARRDTLREAAVGIELLSAPDRHLEARAIALILRETLEHPDRTAALITPDRDLARRVTAELTRWNIKIADTGGTALADHGLGGVCDLLLGCGLDGFSLTSTMALLSHGDVTLNSLRSEFRVRLNQIEVVALRGNVLPNLRPNFTHLITQACARQTKQFHAHPLVKAVQPEDWAVLQNLAQELDRFLAPFENQSIQKFETHIEKIHQALKTLAPQADWNSAEHQTLADFFQELLDHAHRHPPCTFASASLTLRHILRLQKVRREGQGHPRLAIYGTLEARLMGADIMILGGLNEGIWPRQADPGPWLNRVMRHIFELPQPERDIGLSAHDFEQGFCAPRVYLTSSKRIGLSPALPSRWMLRLTTVFKAAGIEGFDPIGRDWVGLAQMLDHGGAMAPLGKPQFAPPVAARPTIFSVTQIEKLIRNPYAIFARVVLELEPLPEFDLAADAALRGSLFHDALAIWNKSGAPDLETLLQAGTQAFADYAIDPAVKSFWWPHFRRLASWLAQQETEFRMSQARIQAESLGVLTFEVEGVAHVVRARADRIDVLQNGSTRIIDYKTGEPPKAGQIETGLAPQMTLEAAIMAEVGFHPIVASPVAEALYMRISGARDGLKKQNIETDVALAELAQKHLTGLKALLGLYRQPSLAYLPRLRVEKDRDEADYDHLSRYLEWQLAGDS